MTGTRPNVVIVLADDLGYSDLGCFGSEIRTPTLDRLAATGVRMTNFHNTPRCSPSRASLLTGLHPHQTGIGILTNDDGPDGYDGNLNDRCVTIAEILKGGGYATMMSGKWHLATDMKKPNDAWPTNRGFDSFYGTLTGCGSYYQPGTLTRDTTNIDDEALDPDYFYTDRIADEAVQFLDKLHQDNPDQPFFVYLPFTAPHWPLHARPETIAHYDGVYDEGWDNLRQARLDRQVELGIVEPGAKLSDRDQSVLAWSEEPDKAWQARRMQAYAAQIEEMDTAIGRVVGKVESLGALDNTLIIFLSDNGASYESVPLVELERFRQRTDIVKTMTKAGQPVRIGNDPTLPPGAENTYASYGKGWANASNTPFRLYKLYAHEGGVSSPFIVHWPAGDLAEGQQVADPFQLINVLPTLLEVTGSNYPERRDNIPVHPITGASMLPAWRNEHVEPADLWWEHVGNAAIQSGRWKLVRQQGWPWELYDITSDRVEMVDLSSKFPDVVQDLALRWEEYAQRVGVIPFDVTMQIYHDRGLRWIDAIG